MSFISGSRILSPEPEVRQESQCRLGIGSGEAQTRQKKQAKKKSSGNDAI